MYSITSVAKINLIIHLYFDTLAQWIITVMHIFLSSICTAMIDYNVHRLGWRLGMDVLGLKTCGLRKYEHDPLCVIYSSAS